MSNVKHRRISGLDERAAYEAGLLNVCPVCRTLQPIAPSEWCDNCKKEPKPASFLKNMPQSVGEITEQQKRNARAKANVYKRRGHLKQKKCELCGDADTEMHHLDYRHPLTVRWLCRACHRRLEREKRYKTDTAESR